MEAKDAITCAERGHVDFFKTVDLEILLKARNRRDESVLTVAALEGRLDCCEVIVERCTPLLYHQHYYNKWSVLHHVAGSNNDNKLENIMKFLITADSKPDLERGGGGAKLPNYRLLTMQNGWGYTALHMAVYYDNHWATKLLLEADRDFELLRMVDEDGRTCLHIAAEKGDQVSAELMIKARPGIEFLKMTERHSKQTALHIAAKKENLAIVQLLIEADHSNDLLAVVDSRQRTALHFAAENRNLEMVKLICDANPNKQLLSLRDSVGDTPLHLASGVRKYERDTPFYLASRVRKFESARLLAQMVDLEAEDAIPCAKIGYVNFFKTVHPDILLNARDKDNNTVLTVAAREGRLDCCQVIVQRCTPLLYHQGGYFKQSVLHEVAYCRQDTTVENIMRFLITADLERGGVGNIPNNRLLTMQDEGGSTALHQAVANRNHRATQLLLEADRNFELLRMVNRHGYTALHMAVMYWNGAIKLLLEADRGFELLRMVDKDGQTCLHTAAKRGNRVAAELILEARPDNEFLKMTQRKSNQTALHIAVEKESLAIVQLLLEADLSNDLLAVVDSGQRTALHYAVGQGNLDMVKLICKAGLDKQLLSMLDSQGNTPLRLASRDEIVELLTEADKEARRKSRDAIRFAKDGDVNSLNKVPLKILLGARDENDIGTVLTVLLERVT